jgi:hypothetical protein
MKSVLVFLLVAAAPLRAADEPAAPAQAFLQQLQRTTPAVSGAVARGRRESLGRVVRARFNVCLADYAEDDLVAALMTNSDECCGWKNTLALANFFR